MDTLDQRKRQKTRLLAWTAAALLAFLTPPCVAAQVTASEYQIKAAYLFDFSKFVKWPADSSFAHVPSFDICILGEDPFGPTLDETVAGEKFGGVPVVVKRLSDAAEARTCHVIFISKSLEPRLNAILATIGTSDSLTVSDIPHFSKRGGMIEFIADGSRVRFGINLDSAQRSRLTVSSELLKVATLVIKTAHAGGLS